MSDVKTRIEAAHYEETLRAAFLAARELGFTNAEQARLFGYVIQHADELNTVKSTAQKCRNLDIEHRAEYINNVMAHLHKLSPNAVGGKEKWLEILQIPGRMQARDLMISHDAWQRHCLLAFLENATRTL